MYQYYNTEPKDEVFALLKKNVKITKERIPAATQLFTPDWIVRYMVENSLGRLWVEGHPNESLKENWKYYLEEAEQEPDVVTQLKKIREEYAKLDLTEIKVIDPCMGSGHILVYAFDVLMQIYTSQGYVERDAAKSILINNLYGIDIDTRAYQLAYFAIMMKARQYNRKIFQENITPNLIAIRNPEDVSTSVLKKLGGMEPVGFRLVEDFEDAEEYGSILQVSYTEDELYRVDKRLEEVEQKAQHGNLLVQIEAAECVRLVKPLIKQAKLLSQKYDVVVTNPPYMNAANMNPKLSQFIKDNFEDYKSDFFSAFMVCCSKMLKQNGYCGFLTPYVWMFIPSYEKLRGYIYDQCTIETLIQFEYSAFEEATVPICSFVISNCSISKKKGLYLRLTEFKGGMDVQRQKALEAINNRKCGFCYSQSSNNFYIIPGMPVAYWLGNRSFDNFLNSTKLSTVIDARIGLVSGDNDRFLRLWPEVGYDAIEFSALPHKDPMTKKWYPLQKGGDCRFWYGNLEYVINWENDGYEIKNDNYLGKRLRAHNFNGEQQFKSGITWNSITSSRFSCRFSPQGFTYNVAGPLCEVTIKSKLKYVLGLLSSVVANYYLSVINPTLNFTSGCLEVLPYLEVEDNRTEDVNRLVTTCIDIAKSDWDSFESSWDFKEHPFVFYSRGLWDITNTMANLSCSYGDVPEEKGKLESCWLLWKTECNKRFNELKENEKELNRIFIDIYGLKDELSSEVSDKDVTVRKADLSRDIRLFISYAVGCMFGRYSLDKTGVILAGQKFESLFANNPVAYQYGEQTMLNGVYLIENGSAQTKCSFAPDADNCIPITDEEYFTDDVVGRFVEFVRVVYGTEALEENLDFLAAALGNKGNTSREVIRDYFLNDFYKDHLKVYQKRPIYWLFDSGKQNGFKALVYMHRWNADTVGNLRIEYLHKMQTVYEHEIETCQDTIDHGSGRDVATATKRKEKLIKQLKECKDYDAKVAHIAFSKIDIDLDDGVKVNYRKVQTGADGKFCEILADSKDIMAKEK